MASPKPKVAGSGNPPPPKNSSNQSAGRPKKAGPLRFANAFKQTATGETRNSPTTDPNIIWYAGLGLVIVAGWSSGRFAAIFKGSWNPGSTKPADFINALKSTIVQILFIFLLAFSARLAPPLASIWLIILIGLWIMWLVKNPSFLQNLTGWLKTQ